MRLNAFSRIVDIPPIDQENLRVLRIKSAEKMRKCCQDASCMLPLRRERSYHVVESH